jgi:hypothetical protein
MITYNSAIGTTMRSNTNGPNTTSSYFWLPS